MSSVAPDQHCTDNVILCASCGSNSENQLGKLGLISAEIKTVLVEPKEKPKQIKRHLLDSARVITAEELNNNLVSDEPRQKRACKSEQGNPAMTRKLQLFCPQPNLVSNLP